MNLNPVQAVRDAAAMLAPDYAPGQRRVNAILHGLNANHGMHVYAGTVFGAEKARRRAKGKAQRLARKAARR